MKKTALLLVIVTVALLILSACQSSTNEIVGVWEAIDGDGIFYFGEEGNGNSANVDYAAESFEYTAKDSKLIFEGDKALETDYSVENDILTITVEEVNYTYEKVKLSESEIDGYLADNGIETEKPPKDGKGNGTTETNPETLPDDSEKEPAPPEKDDTSKGKLTDEEITQSILGAWWHEDDNVSMLYVFYDDGTGIAGLIPFTYSVNNGIISMHIEAFGDVADGSARYEVSGDCLRVENKGKVYVLERREMPEELKKQ
ncbi:MAG: hypothetical protein IKL92_01015 [Oscillospiraceae bacterium]|nr:hypothetical protein [Oscillospiraceae bacterium]